MKRIVVGVVGALLIVLGLAMGGVAATGYTAVGRSGELEYELGTVTAKETLLLVDLDRLEVAIPYIGSLGEIRLGARAAQGQELFLGTATTESVDAYVKGASYAVAYRDAAGWQITHVPGGAMGDPAGREPVWLSTASGARPTVVVPAQRPMTIVASAAKPLDAVTFLAIFTWPSAQAWIIGTAIAGSVVLLLGIALLLIALLRFGQQAAGPSE